MPELILERGKERCVLRRHPWIFASAVARLCGHARPGDTVEVRDARGRMLGRAAWSPRSQIRARVWSFDPEETIDDAFFKRRVARSIARRRALPELRGLDALRLIHAESDGLPGVIADRYGDTVVLQLGSAGAEKWRKAIAAAIVRETGCARLYERSDAGVRAREGLEARTGWLFGGEPGAALLIEEHGLRLEVDIRGGHKTGFYLDQRDNRLAARALAEGRRVLNCFCYTGAFSLNALAGGAAEVLSIDSSGHALDAAQRALALNPELAPRAGRAQWRQADVFEALRSLAAAGHRYDLVILDPPKFAPSGAHLAAAARAYKDINLFAFRLLAPGGLLMSFSCSGGVSPEAFLDIVTEAARDAPREARVLRRLGAAADHPVLLGFPEGEYLKGLLCQAD
ncbi:MAG: 23S rRNA (cytosine(1962)-C(5))-methyltransferase RlmI [Rhodocyclaceae bacterium]